MDTEQPPESLAEALREAIGAFVRRARTVDTQGTGQAAVLGHLARQGPSSITDLAALEHVRHQSMARTVKNLQAAHLVMLTDDPEDGRRVAVQITEVGQRRLEDDRQRRRQWIALAIEAHLSPDERAELQRVPALLRKLTQK